MHYQPTLQSSALTKGWAGPKRAPRLLLRVCWGSPPVGRQLKLEPIALCIQVACRGHAVALDNRKVVAQLGALVHAQPGLVHLSI